LSEAQSATPNRDSNTVLEVIRKNSLAPPMYDPPQSSIQSPLSPPSGGSPPHPQVKRYTLSDGPPGPGRTTSPIRKLRKNQDHSNSSARFVGAAGRAPSPAKTPQTKWIADDMGPVPAAPASEVPIIPSDDKPSKHPTTFAEMGIIGVKAQDKECIIM